MMVITLVLGILIPVISVLSQEPEARVVDTAQGPVRGYLDPEFELFAFYGIPYATAPVGTQRFKPPLPAQERLSTLEAVNEVIQCPQAGKGLPMPYQEDCLVANIFVPDNITTSLPVVVHVHGGSYHYGYGNRNTPKNLVQSKKVIALSFNYRVGVHGFLCLGTEDVPGNAGLKDQVAMLRWIQENIASFGGNPNDVSISGDSAGSSAIDLLMLSKTTEGLFHKVIPESGANVAPWSVQMDPVENAKAYAKSLNFDNVDDISALEDFYKTAAFEYLFTVTDTDQADSSLDFVPCIERDLGQERILDDAPVNILKTGNYKQVPLLYGFTDMEGLIRGSSLLSWKDRINQNFSDVIPPDLQFESEEQKQEVVQKIKEFYFGDRVIGEETVLEYINYFTDFMFAYPTLKSVKLHLEAGHKEIYLYEYSFPSNHMLPGGISVSGANHCAQTLAIFDQNENNISEEYKNMKSVIREMWLNFIVTGAPVPAGSVLPAWPPVNSTERAPHMSLNSLVQLRGAPSLERASFWDDIYDHYYRTPVPPNRSPAIKITGELLLISIFIAGSVLFK